MGSVVFLIIHLFRLNMNGYIVRRSNSANFVSASIPNRGQLLKGENLLLQEHLLSFKSRPPFGKIYSSREANRKSQRQKNMFEYPYVLST